LNQAAEAGGKVLESGTGAVEQAVGGAAGVVDGVMGIFGAGKKTENPPLQETKEESGRVPPKAQ
jgi:hypothetical protein